jgi:hypothetical protein
MIGAWNWPLQRAFIRPQPEKARWARSHKTKIPAKTPLDDPRKKTDWPNTKQTDEPWKGQVEKEQRNDDTKIDLEKWHRTNTH